MIWWLAFEKKPFQFWRGIWIQVVVISYYSCTVTLEKVQPWKWCRYSLFQGIFFWFMQILVHAKNCLHKVKIYRSLVFLESKHVPYLLTLNILLKIIILNCNKTEKHFILQGNAILTCTTAYFTILDCCVYIKT